MVDFSQLYSLTKKQMGKGIERTQVLRIDCNDCRGNGYKRDAKTNVESPCDKCEGRGQLEKEVNFKFETGGKWSPEDLAEVFEIPVEQIRDTGHSTGE